MRADQVKVYYRVEYIDVLHRRFIFETEAVKPDEALRRVANYLYESESSEIEKIETTYEQGVAILSNYGFLLASALGGHRVDEKWRALEV